ncbi:probable E3 ubiquitin-protein ligase DTX2 [Hyalella azteca]|uniref:E3 ubiquitin-protein ligase n=1 Tax=Hyalella azteca TaxID=294128 RepID=A0A8B7P930_HYAAZ|nr:probable E3 ubiquitin-protein ligase DTX2 [Hyalella azteca]
MPNDKSLDGGRGGNPKWTPPKKYNLRNSSNANNFYSVDSTQNSGMQAMPSADGNCTHTSDALISGAMKLPNGRYMLNGMELTKQELDFVLDNTEPQEVPSESSMRQSLMSYIPNFRISLGSKSSKTDATTSQMMKKSEHAQSLHKQIKFRTKPLTAVEKILATHTKEVEDASTSAAAAAEKGPECSICLSNCHEESPYQAQKETSRDIVGSVSLSRCGHVFHACCVLQLVSHDATSIVCPNCKTIHGVMTGTQPPGGTMTVQTQSMHLPGYPHSKTIVVSYNFPRGVQDAKHPNPGRPYYLVGFPRVAYLPDTRQGRQVLSLLRKAFDRRLIFTVGTSATTSQPDCVVWNGVHHKTEVTNHGGHGYPDPNYLDNVTMELAALGVTEDS